jgi:hypothetical protein
MYSIYGMGVDGLKWVGALVMDRNKIRKLSTLAVVSNKNVLYESIHVYLIRSLFVVANKFANLIPIFKRI